MDEGQLSIKKYWRGLKSAGAKKLKSKSIHSRKFWLVAAVATVVITFVVLPALAAKAPGQIGYSIKRGEEFLVSNLAPLSTWRDQLRLNFANNRVSEAAYVADKADQSTVQDQAKAASTINGLLGSYESTYQARTIALNKSLNGSKKLSRADALKFQRAAADTYDELQLLRVQAPDAAQLAVLTAIDDIQTNLATLNDVAGSKPLSASDLAQLTKLVAIGIATKSQVDQLIATTSSRQLHLLLVSMITAGQLPSDIIYQLDQDLIKEADPAHAAIFAAISEFEQMQRISAVVAASRPTAAQKQAIAAFLANYKPGQQLPKDDIQPYAASIAYGIALSGRLLSDLSSLKTIHMSSDDQALLNKWKAVIDPPNLSDIYQRLMTTAESQPDLKLRNLTRIQTELVDAQQAQVSHLVMPPGWKASQLGSLDSQMGIQIAETSFEASKPNVSQELAQINIVQSQLQTALTSLQTTHSQTITKLQDTINNFTGTPEQLAQLKDELKTLNDSQTTTINNLQAQINNISAAHTTLGDAVTDLRQEQLTNLTQLELRAATNAKALTDSAKTELAASLDQINQASQTLITSLQTQVDALGTGQTQLRQELTTDIQTIRNDYTALAANVQGQLDAGAAASGQLAATLQTVQTNLTTQAQQLATLNAGATALTTLVNQVQTTANAQAASLQSQIDGLNISQQAVETSLSSLSDQQIADVADLNSQLANLRVVQTEAQAVISTLGTQMTQAQASITNLGNNFDSLQTALVQAQTIQTALQTDVANQQSELDSLTSQTQSAIDTLTAGQTQLAGQITGLANNVTTLSQTLTTVQTASATTQAQLDTLLATPPWAIPAGTYVTQSEFDTLTATINAQFATKAAALDAQFQAYQQTLNASVSQVTTQVNNLSTTVTTNATSQAATQAQVNTLNSQVQTLQTQLQQLINAGTGGTPGL